MGSKWIVESCGEWWTEVDCGRHVRVEWEGIEIE